MSAPFTKRLCFIPERDWLQNLKRRSSNDTEFNHAGEMSVDDRHLYHKALESVFPPNIAVSAKEVEVLAVQSGFRQKKCC